MNDATTPTPPLHRASWLDHFFDAVRGAPAPAWLCYVGLWLLLFALFAGLAWGDKLLSPAILLLVAADEALYIVYYLALMHYLDHTANAAMAQFRPLLALDDAAFARLRYELTTLPAAGALLAAGAGSAVTLISLQFTPADAILALVIRQPSTQAAFLAGNAILAIFVYHTVRQLCLVSRIHKLVTHLTPYRRGPVYAFSRLTALTALGWILGQSLGLSPRIAPLLTPDKLILLWLPLGVLATLLFVLPLAGVHHLLAREKARLRAEVEQRVEATLQQVHSRQDTSELESVGNLKTLLDTLLAERDLVTRLPTWPWRPGALAGFASALLLPLAIWLIQQLLANWLPG